MVRALADPDVRAPARERLRADLERLGRELGAGGGAAPVGVGGASWPPAAAGEEEALLAALRDALGALARAHGLGPGTDPATARLVAAALDGAHLSARCELLAGSEEAIRGLLPGLVYAVLSPLAGPAAAGRAALDSAKLIAGG